MSALDDYVARFLRERVYLHNITPKTREFYETAWKGYQRAQDGRPPRAANAPLITRGDLLPFSTELRKPCFASAE